MTDKDRNALFDEISRVYTDVHSCEDLLLDAGLEIQRLPPLGQSATSVYWGRVRREIGRGVGPGEPAEVYSALARAAQKKHPGNPVFERLGRPSTEEETIQPSTKTQTNAIRGRRSRTVYALFAAILFVSLTAFAWVRWPRRDPVCVPESDMIAVPSPRVAVEFEVDESVYDHLWVPVSDNFIKETEKILAEVANGHHPCMEWTSARTADNARASMSVRLVYSQDKELVMEYSRTIDGWPDYTFDEMTTISTGYLPQQDFHGKLSRAFQRQLERRAFRRELTTNLFQNLTITKAITVDSISKHIVVPVPSARIRLSPDASLKIFIPEPLCPDPQRDCGEIFAKVREKGTFVAASLDRITCCALKDGWHKDMCKIPKMRGTLAWLAEHEHCHPGEPGCRQPGQFNAP